MAASGPSAEALFTAIQAAVEEVGSGTEGVHAEDILSALATHVAVVVAYAPDKAKRDYCLRGFQRVLRDAVAARVDRGPAENRPH